MSADPIDEANECPLVRRGIASVAVVDTAEDVALILDLILMALEEQGPLMRLYIESVSSVFPSLLWKGYRSASLLSSDGWD